MISLPFNKFSFSFFSKILHSRLYILASCYIILETPATCYRRRLYKNVSLNPISIWEGNSIIQHNKSLRLFGDIMAEKPFVLLIFKRSLLFCVKTKQKESMLYDGCLPISTSVYIYIRSQYFLMLFGGWRVAFRFLLLLLPFFGHAWKMFEYMLEMFIIFHCVIGISRNEMFCTRNGSLNNLVNFGYRI